MSREISSWREPKYVVLAIVALLTFVLTAYEDGTATAMLVILAIPCAVVPAYSLARIIQQSLPALRYKERQRRLLMLVANLGILGASVGVIVWVLPERIHKWLLAMNVILFIVFAAYSLVSSRHGRDHG